MDEQLLEDLVYATKASNSTLVPCSGLVAVFGECRGPSKVFPVPLWTALVVGFIKSVDTDSAGPTERRGRAVPAPAVAYTAAVIFPGEYWVTAIDEGGITTDFLGITTVDEYKANRARWEAMAAEQRDMAQRIADPDTRRRPIHVAVES